MADEVRDMLVLSLDERWKEYRLRFKLCRREFSEDAVHDLRVAARRLLAILDLARALEPHPRIKKVRRFLKNQVDNLDDLRDVQVMMVEVVKDLESLPQLEPFELHLKKREKRFLRKARRGIQASKPSGLSKRMGKIRTMLQEFSQGDAFSTRLLEIVDTFFTRTNRAYEEIDSMQPASIHRLRLIFKKFRYIVELVHPLLPGYPETHWKRMHDYQSRMGDIQDTRTLLNALMNFAEKSAVSFDVQPIRRFYEKRYDEAAAVFIEDKGELFTFWRTASDQNFPWEKPHDSVHHPSRHRRTGRGTGRRR